MAKSIAWGLLLPLCFLVSCQCPSGQPRLASDVLEREVAAIRLGVMKQVDFVAHAEAAGYDLPDLIERCYRGVPGGLHDLFAISQTGIDTAASQSYAGWLGKVLRAAGDNRFGDQLARETNMVQSDVRDHLLYDFNCPDFITPCELKDRYPVTFPIDTLVMEFSHTPYETPEIDRALTVYLELHGDDAIVYTEVCHIPRARERNSNEDIYIVRYDWQSDWWGSWVVFGKTDGGAGNWIATIDGEGSVTNNWGGNEPGGQSIYAIRALWLEGQHNPFVEIIDNTHMGHGSIYLYELDIHKQSLRLVLTTEIMDRHQNNDLIDDGGVLKISYRDINSDGYTDVMFTGSATCNIKGIEYDENGEASATWGPDHQIALRKTYLWSADDDHFVTDRTTWLWFDQVYGEDD